MAQPTVTKIYELKTLGYDTIVTQLRNVDASFESIRKTKIALNQQKMTTDDAITLDKLNAELTAAKIKTQELRLEKQNLTNELKASQNVRQAEINAEKAASLAAKATTDAIKVESGSYTDLIARRKELQTLIDRSNGNSPIVFEGQTLNQTQAIEQYQLLSSAIAEYKAQLKGVQPILEAEAGSYSEIIALQKELYPLLKNANANSVLSFNGQNISFQQGIDEYKRLSAAEQAFRRQFQGDSVLVGEYTSGIVQAFKSMGLEDLIGGQITRTQTRINELNSTFESLKAELRSLQAAGDAEGLARVEKDLIANRNEANQLTASLERVQAQMRGMGDIGNQITTSIASGFERVGKQIGQLVISYLGFQALFTGATKLISENKSLSDEFADLQIRIHGTTEDTEKLFETLKKLDTRTSLAGLVDIANVVAKKGVAKEDIADITKALNDLFVVLGKEIGDPADATASIVKLITIFNNDKHITAERVNEIGASLFKLTTTGVATGEFLINFAERVGSIRGITDLTLPSILGMGAALQQLGQTSRIAGTAAIQLTTALFSNVPKFAKAAGVSVDEFKKMLKDDPFGALVKTAEALKNSSDELPEVVEAFDKVGVQGVRIKAVMADIATNGAFVSQRMKQAAVSSADYANQTAAATLKQNTFAAVLDKIAKQFEILGTNVTVRATLLGIASVISLLVGNLPILLGALALLATAWAVQNASLLLLRAQVIGYNLAIGAMSIAYGALYVAQGLYTVGLVALRAVMVVVSAAARLMNAAFLASPLGVFAGLVAGAVILLNRFGSSIDNVGKRLNAHTQALKDHITQLNIRNQVLAKASEQTAGQISQIETWATVIRASTSDTDTQMAALQKLIEINGKFSAAVKGNTVDLGELSKALKQVEADIQNAANAEASASLAADKYKAYLKVVSVRQQVETAVATGKPLDISDKATRQIALNVPDEAQLRDFNGDLIIGGISYNSKKYIAALKKVEQEGLDAYTQFQKTAADYAAKTIQKAQDEQKAAAATINPKDPLTATELESLIKDINKQLETLKEGDPKIEELRNERDSFQKRLDAIMAKPLKIRADRLTPDDQNSLNTIQAQLDNELAIENKRFNDLQRLHTATFDDERDHVNKLAEINTKYINEKIASFGNESDLNAKELQELNKFKEQKSKILLDSFNNLKNIDKKEYDEKRTALKNELDLQIKAIQDSVANVNRDPNSTPSQRAQAKLDGDRQILDLEQQFGLAMDALEKKFNQRTVENAKNLQDMLHKTTQEIIDDQTKLALAAIADITESGNRLIAEFKSQIAALKLQNDTSNKPISKKAVTDTNLDFQEQVGVLAREVAMDTNALPQYKKLLAEKKITDEDYNKFVTELYTKQKQLHDLLDAGVDQSANKVKTLGDFIQKSLIDIFDIKDNGKKQALAEVLKASFELATTAMNDYFDEERNRIEQSKQATLDRIDAQEQIALAQSQSAAESAAIEHQAQIEKDAANKKAFEQDKKLKLQQLAINYALQLSNIAVAASANPLNVFTFGAAGIAQYVIQAAIATAAYFLNRGAINSATYAFGGNPDTETIRGGRVKGRSHKDGGNPFIFKGRVFEDEVDELNVIRTKNVDPTKKHTITGTHTEIASMLNKLGGGIEFKPGARLLKFATGGNLGASLSAPIFTPSSSVSNTVVNNQVDFTPFMEEIRNLADEQSKRIDRIEVLQVTSSVTKAQTKIVKQTKIGTL